MKKAIDKLNKLFPGINAVCSSEWDGDEGYIWFRQEGNSGEDGILYFDYYNEGEQVHYMVDKVLRELGLYAEPYDSGTWMAYKA